MTNVDKGQQFAEHKLDPKLSRRLPKKVSPGGPSWPVNGKPKGKIVLLYSESNHRFLEQSTFVAFLESMAREEELDFSWDKRTLEAAQLKARFDEADTVVCLVSQPFLISNYPRELESKIEAGREKKQVIIVVPVMLEACSWGKNEWLSKYDPLPEEGKYIIPDHNRDRARTFKAIVDNIRVRIRNRQQAVVSTAPAEAFHEPRALYTLRRLPDSSFSAEEMESLVDDSVRRAEKFVEDPEKRRKICEAAKNEKEKNKGQPLSKRQLEELDKRFLARGKRNPDAEKVRWVLRAARLHPQGRVVG